MDNQALATEWTALTEAVAAQGERWGGPSETLPNLPKTLIEFVSADPTGPISLHRARNGVIGDSLSRLLLFAGCAQSVHREFYVNDAASGLRVAARTLWAGKNDGDAPLPAEELRKALPQNPQAAHYARAPFEEAAPFLQAFVADFWLKEQQRVLENLGVLFDQFFKESHLHGGTQVGKVLAHLQEAHMASEEYGALWLRSSRITNGERDHVLRRADGSVTYLAADLVYHKSKFDRGYEKLVDVWSADHADYIGRTRAGLTALGLDSDALHIVLCESVRVLQNGVEVAAGGSVADLTAEAGASALRFALLFAPENTPLVLDTDALREKRGPFETVRCALQSTSQASGDGAAGAGDLGAHLAAFPETLQNAARGNSPYAVAQYVFDTAEAWNAEAGAGNAPLARVVWQTLANGLGVLGIAPDGGLLC